MARTSGSSSARNTGSRANRSRSSNDSSANRRTSSSGSSDWSSGVIDLARERPIAAAAVAAGAAAAGLFMWSKRSQISNQLSNLSAQIGDWSQNVGSDNLASEFGDDTGGLVASSSNVRSRPAGSPSRATGGGNATLGSAAGGAGTRSNASGRGRAQSTAATQE